MEKVIQILISLLSTIFKGPKKPKKAPKPPVRSTKTPPKPVSGFTLSARSEENLNGVHPALVRVMRRAIELSTVDFIIIDGLRTVAEQRILLTEGKSKTRNSYHLRQPSGFSHAVDVVPYPVDWSDSGKFRSISVAVKEAGRELGVPIEWGGDWKSFIDLGHFQIPRDYYV